MLYTMYKHYVFASMASSGFYPLLYYVATLRGLATHSITQRKHIMGYTIDYSKVCLPPVKETQEQEWIKNDGDAELVAVPYQDKNIRSMNKDDGSIWFVARDILSSSKSKTTVSALEASIRDGLGDEFVNNQPIIDSMGRKQNALIIHEAAVTFFVSRSRTEEGKKLNRLIHVEILPAMRKRNTPNLDDYTKSLVHFNTEVFAALQDTKKVNEELKNQLAVYTKHINKHQQAAIKKSVDKKFAEILSVHPYAPHNGIYKFVWGCLKHSFNIASYDQLNPQDFDSAIDLIENLNTASYKYRPPAEEQEVQEANNKNINITLSIPPNASSQFLTQLTKALADA